MLGKKDFACLIRDCARMYNMGFLAILERRVSGAQPEEIVNKFAFDTIVRSDPLGFSGDIWCCWNSSSFSIQVLDVRLQCIHLRVNDLVHGDWLLFVVYGNRQERLRVEL